MTCEKVIIFVSLLLIGGALVLQGGGGGGFSPTEGGLWSWGAYALPR